ncbi:NAD(P)H-quinone oxidoreductase [Spectribacter hydrogenoxidans]|uniref:NAD(P)H-quinone oxidoreductase n=1 Tax=Spectribacter hydrogenoxidans TaxID=3075608 RepID=A0ABU3C3A4_9GAMM|nr:NAD(P)H-quinone oxidoreductase [Salinisphaera sp. W335]MDT0636027.1 NAD(P)H-quinone oxidoreductase [Salinisphaera sp. W335]
MPANIPQTMTEIAITQPGDADVLQSRVVDVPAPGRGELLVRVVAAGVNRPDIMQRQGNYPMPPGVNPTPGLEVAGTIVAVGDQVTTHAVGDRVCGLTEGGGYAEYCLLPATQALPIPGGLTMSEAAALPETYFTVWANLFDTAGVKRGDTVLIHGGTSGIGTTALALCRAFGITTLATAGSDDKCRAVEDLGGIAINYRETDFGEAVAGHTNGQGVDTILDVVGAKYFNRNLAALARDGRLIVIGFMGGVTADQVDLLTLVLKRAHITGSTMRARSKAEKAAIADALRQQVWPLLASGDCTRPIIHATFPLADAAEAHREMEAGRHIGKIMLTVSSADP